MQKHILFWPLIVFSSLNENCECKTLEFYTKELLRNLYFRVRYEYILKRLYLCHLLSSCSWIHYILSRAKPSHMRQDWAFKYVFQKLPPSISAEGKMAFEDCGISQLRLVFMAQYFNKFNLSHNTAQMTGSITPHGRVSELAANEVSAVRFTPKLPDIRNNFHLILAVHKRAIAISTQPEHEDFIEVQRKTINQKLLILFWYHVW